MEQQRLEVHKVKLEKTHSLPEGVYAAIEWDTWEELYRWLLKRGIVEFRNDEEEEDDS